MKYKITVKNSKKKLIVFLTVLFLLTLAVPAFAETVQELERQKQAAQQAINKAQYTVDQGQTTIDGIERELVASNEVIDSLQKEIQTLNSEISALQAQIVQTTSEMEDAMKKEQAQSESMDERLRIQYMYGQDGYTEALFEGDSITQQIENTEIVTDIIQADQQLMDAYTQAKEDVQAKKAQLEAQKAAQDQKKADLDAKLEQQNNIKSQQESLLAKNQAMIEEAKAEIAKEEASIAEANRKIKEITAKAEAEAKEKQLQKARAVTQKAKESASEAKAVADDMSQRYQASQDAQVTQLVNEIVTYSDQAQAQAANIETMEATAESSPTAAQAVEAIKDVESHLTAVMENEALAREAKVRLLEVDFAQKKSEAQDAAAKAQVFREEAEQAEAQKDLEKVMAFANEAQKNVQNTQTEIEVGQEEADEARQEVEDRETGGEEVEVEVSPVTDSNFVSSSGWRWPLDGIYDITSVFGYRIHPIFGVGRGHEGIDIGADTGTPIHACDGGEVISAGENGGYGNCVIIQQDSGHQVYYAHQSRMAVSVGQRVEKGEIIGYVGSTGWSTGPHLHLGVISGGEFVDPFIYFPEVDSGSVE